MRIQPKTEWWTKSSKSSGLPFKWKEIFHFPSQSEIPSEVFSIEDLILCGQFRFAFWSEWETRRTATFPRKIKIFFVAKCWMNEDLLQPSLRRYSIAEDLSTESSGNSREVTMSSSCASTCILCCCRKKVMNDGSIATQRVIYIKYIQEGTSSRMNLIHWIFNDCRCSQQTRTQRHKCELHQSCSTFKGVRWQTRYLLPL